MMNWKQIDRDSRKQRQGEYSEWKQEIADTCFNQCVYCAINEGLWGGIDHYHIDHFRPHSIDRFKELINTITNLYYSCPICNRFKSNDWPNDPDDLDIACYPDPSDHDYSELFGFDPTNFSINGKNEAAKYIIIRLYLNRPQLIYERREQLLKLRAITLVDEVKQLNSKLENVILLRKSTNLLADIANHLHLREKVIPYKLVDIRKQ